MAERQPTPNDDHLSPEASAFQQFLEDWIAAAPPALAEAARYAALPHSFDIALFNYLRGTDEDTEALLARLERSGLIAAAGPDRYAFEPGLRELYLRRWQTGDPESYRRASARAAEFYRPRPGMDEADQIEYVYHLLGADDSRGTKALADAFERAWTARRLGLAERLVQYATEQAPVLGSGAQQWLHLFQARLDLATYHYARSEGALRSLITAEVEPRLRARALVALADILVATQRWSEALDCYEQAHDLYLQLDDRFNAAGALEAQGIAYLHLASSVGGIYESTEALEPWHQRWSRRIQYAPYLIYRWFSRRISVLPNLFFGGDYQDWIIFRLLYGAIESFEQAAGQLAAIPEGADLPVAERSADVQIHLADLYHRVGSWTRAEHLFSTLATAAPVAASDYRRATLQLAQGRAALGESLPDKAQGHLQDAHEVFARYDDHRTLATTARLLGDAKVAAGNPNEAIPHYDESADASLAVEDLLASTHIWSTLGKMRKRFSLSPAALAQAGALEEKLDRRAYIIRFRGAMLQRFRRLATNLAVYLVLPLTYLVMAAIHLLMHTRGLQQLALLPILLPVVPILVFFPDAAPVADLAAGVLMFLAVLLPAVWTYGFFYILAGWLFVRRLSVGDIARHQAEFVFTVPEGISLRDEDGQLNELPWATVQSYISANRATWRTPMALFSQLFLISQATSLAIDGIARHYSSLQKDIQGRLEQADNAGAGRLLDFSLFRSWWSLAAVLLTMCLSVVSLFDWLDPACREPNIIDWVSERLDYAYVSTDDGRLHVIDLWDYPPTLTVVNSYDVPRQIRDIAVVGDYAYVAASEAGLRVIDISDPAAPIEVGFYDTPGQASGVAMAGDYAYVADGTEGLRVVDIENPAAPIEAGFYVTPGRASDVAATGHLAFVAAGDEGLRVVGVRDPTTPAEVGFSRTGGEASGVAVAGQYAYVAAGSGGLRIVSLRNPTMPTEVGVYDTPGQASDVALMGSIAFVADGTGGLQVVNVTDPTAPTRVGAVDTPGQATSVAVTFDSAYLADGAGGFRIIDVLNPCDSVEETGQLEVGGSVESVAAFKAQTLPLASVSFELLFWALLVFPIIGLCRLLYNRAALRRALRPRFSLDGDWPLWLALILLIGWTVFQVWALTW